MVYLAVIPAIFLMFYVYKADKVEKEPIGLLVKIFIGGVLTTISAIILETIGENVLSVFVYQDSYLFVFLENFFVVALAEEAGKYLVVKKVAWKHPAFNYTFDAVVYAVFASLGFAALENILYLTDATITTAVMRGVLAVPGHAIDAVFMGSYFGYAKRCEALGDKAGTKNNLRKALWIPVFIHGFYDFCLSVDFELAIVVFFVFEIFITIYAVKKVKKLSASDTAIFPDGRYPGATTVSQLVGQGVIELDQTSGQVVYHVPPKMNYDPVTGEPLDMAQTQQNYNYDPMTGEKLR
jgi:RsiW-degrading membrane proteinase PrsW (M82 family)